MSWRQAAALLSRKFQGSPGHSGGVLDVLLAIQQTLSSKGLQLLSHTSATPPAKKALQEFPLQVRRDIGFALYQVQQGKTTRNSKPLKGFGGAGVLEIIEDYDGDTYRAVYTVKFENILYILHCFQKKSKKGKATPKEDIDLIKQRLKLAEISYQEWLKNQGE